MDGTARAIAKRFAAARSLIDSAAAVAQAHAPATLKTVTDAGDALTAAEHAYALRAAPLLIVRGGSADYMRIVSTGNYAGQADAAVMTAVQALQRAGLQLTMASLAETAARGRVRAPDLQRLIDQYPRADTLSVAVAAPAVDHCGACDSPMSADVMTARMRCAGCGALANDVTLAFDENQCFVQDSMKTRSGCGNPNRHYQYWWDRLQAREPSTEIGDKDDPENQHGEKVIAALRAIVVRDGKVLRRTTINEVRAMLREIGRTTLNKNAALILKRLTGVGPPSIPEAIAVRAENLFTKIVEVAERLRRQQHGYSGDNNRHYYPYYIMKILERIIPKNDLETRRIFYYIYIQSPETISSNDAEWLLICNELGEIDYVPTDRTLGSRYPPI
jgi:hypothetical protein